MTGRSSSSLEESNMSGHGPAHRAGQPFEDVPVRSRPTERGGSERSHPETRRDELELGQFIPLHYHFNMLNDAARTGAFESAIEATVPRGGRVVELGGGTGVLSYFATRKAARVWCIERNPELAGAARRLLLANGADTVEVVEADARSFVPPEPVDVVVCEMLHV